MYVQDKYISPEFLHTDEQRATKRLAEFSRGRPEVKAIAPWYKEVASYFCYGPQTPCFEKRLLSITNHREQVASVTKNERREKNGNRKKETEEETGKRRRGWRERAMLKGKSRKALSTPRCRRQSRARPILLRLSRNSPDSHVEFRGNVDEGRRNA